MTQQQIKWTLFCAMFFAVPSFHFALAFGGFIPPLGIVLEALRMLVATVRSPHHGQLELLLVPILLGFALLWGALFLWASSRIARLMTKVGDGPRTILTVLLTTCILALSFAPLCLMGSAGGGSGATTWVSELCAIIKDFRNVP